MKLFTLLSGTWLCLSLPMLAAAQDSLADVVAPGAEAQLVSRQFKFTEGPAVDKAGNIYFTDQPNNTIWKYSTNGQLSLFMENAGRSNGLFIDKKGNIIACADEKNEMWRITPKGKVTVIMDNYEGKKMNGPNDLWLTASGNIYFTDPYYQRNYWERKKPEMETQQVYLLRKGKKQAERVTTDILQPNGIVGSPDGKYLYVADIRDNKTYKYTIEKNGTLGNKQLHCAKGGDGITLDHLGNLYISSNNGVYVFNQKGEQIRFIKVASDWAANVCFGGKDRKTLFITAKEGVYTVNMNVHGVE